MKSLLLAVAATALLAGCATAGGQQQPAQSAQAQQPSRPRVADPYPSTYRAYPGVPTLVTGVTIYDGEGGRIDNGSVLFADGEIVELGQNVAAPEGATVIDLTGRSVIPGLVMVHEHLYYPTGPQVYGQLGQSFIRLYLAGGVTTMRTGGNVNGFTLDRSIGTFFLTHPDIQAVSFVGSTPIAQSIYARAS